MESESDPLLGHESGAADDVRTRNCSGRKDSSASEAGGSSASSTHSEQESNGGKPWQFYLEVGNFVVSTFLGGVANSIFSPFYTKEATDKGLSVGQSGVVFFASYITQIVFMPIFGKFISQIGSRRMFVFGLFLAGLCNLGFGCLRFADQPQLFFGLSLAILALSSIGYSAIFSSVYTLATGAVSRRYRASMLSVIETSFGVGMMIGPSVGGVLYDVGGFNLPFYITGTLLVISSCVTLAVQKTQRTSETTNPTIVLDQTTKYKQLFRDPAIAACFAIVIVSEMSVAWVLPTFERFLSANFSLNSTITGIIFSLEGITYAIFTPFIGWLLDRGVPKYCGLMFGASAAVVGLCLMGPVPGLSHIVPKSPYTSAVGLSIVGTGIAATFITTLTCMLSSGSKIASDSEQTQSMITSLWMIGEIFGTSFGTLFGGMSYDAIGFENGLLVVAGIQVLAFALVPLTSNCLMKKLTGSTNNNNSKGYSRVYGIDDEGSSPNGHVQMP